MDDDYSPASCADDLFAVLEALRLDQIVGHSYGACVALAAAAAKPNWIALVGTGRSANRLHPILPRGV